MATRKVPRLGFMSGALFAEYSEILHRPAIAHLHLRAARETDRLLMVIAASGMWRNPASADPAPDSGDDHLSALLANWTGSRLITGDRRLLDRPPRPGTVLTPRAADSLIRQP